MLRTWGKMHPSDHGVFGSGSRDGYDGEGSGVCDGRNVPDSRATVLGLAETVALSVATVKAPLYSRCNRVFFRCWKSALNFTGKKKSQAY